MRYDPSSLKWGVTDNSDKLIAAFDDHATASSFKETSSDFKIVDLETGKVREQELAGSGAIEG